MANDASLRAVLKLDTSQYTTAMSNAARQTETDSEKITKAQASVARGFGQIALAAATAGGIIVGAFLIKATKVFIDFEHSVTRTQAILKITAQEMKPIEDEILRVASASSFTATEVAEAAQVLALAGLQYEELVSDKAIERLTTFAILAGTDAETAAGIALSATKGFRIEIENMDRVMNTMVNTFTSSFVTLETLGMSLKFLGPTASAAGITIEEAAAAVGALGNAGLQGTLAGTGLRMALNKLLTPTDDARKAMFRLGLDVLTLTPAGMEANAALGAVTVTLDQVKLSAEQTTYQIDILENRLSDLSIEQQKNTIAIQRIRQRAARQNRDLTDEEIRTIGRLEMANSELSIQQQELSVEQQLAQRKQKSQNATIREQGAEYSRLKQIVQSQTTGITSLTEVIDQLEISMATTSEILKIFGTRGGTAVLALQSQAEAFREMGQANIDAQMNIEGTGTAMDQMLDIVTSDTQFALDLIRSNFEEAFIEIGRQFAPLIYEADGLKDSLVEIAQTLKDNSGDFAEFASMLRDDILPAIAKLPGLVDDLTGAFRTLAPIIRFVGNTMKLILAIIDLITWAIEGLMKGVGMIADGIGGIGKKLGIGGGSNNASEGLEVAGAVAGQAATGAAVGAGVGATLGLLGGPFAPITVTGGAIAGAGVGAIVGGAGEFGNQMGLFHKGGIATGPTPGIFGEGGAEALLPLTNKASMSMIADAIVEAGARGGSPRASRGSVMNFHFGTITVNGDPSISSADIEKMLEKQLTKIMKKSLFRGARGVF